MEQIDDKDGAGGNGNVGNDVVDEEEEEGEQEGREYSEEKEEERDHGDESQHQEENNYHSDDSQGPDDDMMIVAKEPSYKKANKIKFAVLCKRLETLARFGREKAKRNVTKEEKLEHLLPAKLLQKIKPGSAFPLLRLLMPDRDSTLKVKTRESTLGQAYCEVLGHEKGSKYWKILSNCTDPRACGEEFSDTVGDFSRTLEKVVARSTKNRPSEATVGDINKILDGLTNDLSGGKSFQKHSNHDWRSSDSQSQSKGAPKTAKGKRKTTNKRVKWVRKAIDELKLSPLEHKWLAKIIIQDRMHLGIGWEAILTWYSRHAMDVWSVHNNLKTVCNKLCDEQYVRQREKEIEESEQRRKAQRFTQLYSFPANPDPVFLGNTISAMRSERTSFESLMYDMRKKHAEVVKKKLKKDDPLKDSLSLKFPAFVAEVKLDGERMIVHINRGQVTMHTRKGRWYSPPYSPIVGPGLRRALSKYDVDVILDGEIFAWDDGRKENVPFGSNRTVAILRRKWLAAQGMLEEIDLGLHEGEDDKYVMRDKDIIAFEKGANNESLEGGAECWLKYVAFDVLYVGGPDATKVMAESLPSEEEPKTSPGSLIHLSGFERRRVLYRLIEPHENEVEIVQSVVIRPNGDCARGEEYFSPKDPLMDPSGLPAYIVDSAKWTLNVGHPQLKDLDEERRKGRNDVVISSRRTSYVNQFYHSIVDQQKLEGILVKDLAAPYILRNRNGLWLKIKPDYSNDSFASDIDVVVIGGSFASGLRRAGEISSFLCACVDSEDPKKYFTFCRLNAQSLKDGKLDEIMKQTEFCKATPESPVSYGKWFREQEHGESLPEFISMRSFQVGREDRQGWRFDRIQNYPDLFIHPDDSVVVTVNASEIVRSDEYSAGLTLRFPRGTRLRIGADEKPPSDIESEEDLYRMYDDYKQTMRKYATASAAGFDPTSPSKRGSSEEDKIINQFLTAEQYAKDQHNRVTRRRVIGNVEHLVIPERKKSNALAGLKFCVLEGVYHFNQSGLDSEDAKSEGWFQEACSVRKAMDVRSFIAMHGGSVVRTPGRDVFVIGGNVVDARVKYNVQGFEALQDRESKRKAKNDSDTATKLDLPGVLKWTFVFSLVHRWLNAKNALPLENSDDDSSDEEEGDADDDDECIKETLPDLLSPRFFDFLAQSEEYGKDPYESIWKQGNLDVVGMKRALSFLQDSTDSRVAKEAKVLHEKSAPWQDAAIELLSEDDRWIMGCHYQTLWPHAAQGNNQSFNKKEAIVIYPDLFGVNFGASSKSDACPDDDKYPYSRRWKEVSPSVSGSSLASSLPLLRCMGAVVTGHLHDGVTHILCELKDDLKSISWPSGDFTNAFRNVEQGHRLLERLRYVTKGVEVSQVLFVSRVWVVSKWNT